MFSRLAVAKPALMGEDVKMKAFSYCAFSKQRANFLNHNFS
jgi:hypothetical protein